jgi:hypothetical protein
MSIFRLMADFFCFFAFSGRDEAPAGEPAVFK